MWQNTFGSTLAEVMACSLYEYDQMIFTGSDIFMYRQTSNIRRARVGYEIVDHSDVVGASPVGAAPTTSSLST